MQSVGCAESVGCICTPDSVQIGRVCRPVHLSLQTAVFVCAESAVLTFLLNLGSSYDPKVAVLENRCRLQSSGNDQSRKTNQQRAKRLYSDRAKTVHKEYRCFRIRRHRGCYKIIKFCVCPSIKVNTQSFVTTVCKTLAKHC